MAKEPHFFDYIKLQARIKAGKVNAECENSFIDVPVLPLLDGVEFPTHKTIRSLISNDKLRDAIIQLEKSPLIQDEDSKDQISKIKGRLAAFENNKKLKAIDQGQQNLERNKIRSSILQCAKNLETNSDLNSPF